MTRRPRPVWEFVLFGILLSTGALAQSYSPEGREIETKGFKTLKKGELKKADDLSGIACLPMDASGKRACIVINDQDTFAQRATLNGDKLEGGKLVPLIDKNRQEQILGLKPDPLDCSSKLTEFKDLDGEGVAYARPFFYIVGSHGCSRNENIEVTSALILARVRVDDEGKPIGDGLAAVEATYRLNDVLRNNLEVRAYYGHDLKSEPPGLNVEGIAAIGNNLYVGLRAPSIKKRAYIIEAEISDLFAKGNARSQSKGRSYPIDFSDENVGIRDLAPLDDGRLLILAGPTLDQGVRFSIHVFDPAKGTQQKLVDLKDVLDDDNERAKAEAMWPLGGIGKPILLLFDGLKNGGARIYRPD